MKKSILLMIVIGLVFTALGAVEMRLGVTYGGRTMNSGEIKDTYGSAAVYFPYIGVQFYRGLTLGIGYEGGYDRSGKIGLYQEDSSMKISGFEVFAAYQFQMKKFMPYVQLGFGSYSYRQSVTSPSAQKVDATKSTLCLGFGARYTFFKKFFVSADFKYVPLKVKPIEETVDLGGFRYSLGVGYAFKL